jgi:hypothetical protein
MTNPRSHSEVRKTLRPGDPGTRRFARDWGERLVCVRYRVDPSKRLRYTTVEIVASTPKAWRPPSRPAPSALVYVRTGGDEWELKQRLRAARAVWEPELGAWRLRYETAVRLKLRRRILLRRPSARSPNLPIPDHPDLAISAHKRENPSRNS